MPRSRPADAVGFFAADGNRLLPSDVCCGMYIDVSMFVAVSPWLLGGQKHTGPQRGGLAWPRDWFGFSGLALTSESFAR